jgi:hypothetical protein
LLVPTSGDTFFLFSLCREQAFFLKESRELRLHSQIQITLLDNTVYESELKNIRPFLSPSQQGQHFVTGSSLLDSEKIGCNDFTHK